MAADQSHFLVLFLDSIGIGAGIVCQRELLPYADVLCPPVEIAQINGTVESLSYGVIAHLPLLDRLARALRRDADMEFALRIFRLGDYAADDGSPVGAVNRNAAELAQKALDWPEEEFFLDHYVGYMAGASIIEVRNEESRMLV